jgi:hypothetical protein
MPHAAQPRMPVIVLAVAAVLAVAIAGPASAGTLKPRRGIYDCYQLDLYGMHYVNSVQLGKQGRYTFAYDRHGSHLVPPTLHGTYRVKGRLILWRSGVFHREHLKGKVFRSTSTKPPLYFKMLSTKTGKFTGVSCDLT